MNDIIRMKIVFEDIWYSKTTVITLHLNLAGHHKSHYVNQIYYHQLKQIAVCYLSNYETILKRFHENHNFPVYTEVWNGQKTFQ